ncbi:MAG: glyoxalase [Bacteroidia bacterium]|nr:glyoxalase [Bacteroidia bacterium]NND09612.1 glyoxalase [Flavobacteriaceae bacterium]MBT8310534.1 glyoxalase [Bacteroidia bacterium]NNK27329.1 glyoxalase [Flavobacteriaceae bacterium]NNL61453.1 glyoxalase [Flavobacteriaceae bacterium]
MINKSTSIRAFIGAINYDESRDFYKKLGFVETIIDKKMSLFRVNENLSFYLQDSYVKDWVDNSMLLLEVPDVDACMEDLIQRDLHNQYERVRLSKIRESHHGREIFMHDPSGVLWHFFQFN